LPPTEAAELEREYVAHRNAVLAMLRRDFGGVPDHDELYQDAWTELLELRSRGDRLKSVRGLLKTIAWRRARDRLRKMKPDTLDPSRHRRRARLDGQRRALRLCRARHRLPPARHPTPPHPAYRPQTNGKAERFIRTLLGEWAYAATYASSAERTRALDGFLWHYNHRRRHAALNRQTPAQRLSNLLGNYT
jgi:DNA-directed RNA polymerase specialized sigma24 family protein